MLIILILFSSFVGVSFAEKGIQAYNIEITNEYVGAISVCSCSLCTNRHHHYHYFVNYCPACKRKGSLLFEEGPASNNQCPEGMWYCSHCDADYCFVHGKEHRKPTKNYLIEYYKKFTVKNISNVEAVPVYETIVFQNNEYKIKKDIIKKIKNTNILAI